MKTNIIRILVPLALCLMAIAVIAVMVIVKTASAQPSTITFETTAIATTSVAYLVSGTGSTIFQFDNPVFGSGKIANMQGVDSVSLYVQGAASSTATSFSILPQYSNNGLDWYSNGIATSSTAGGAFALASSTVYTWIPGTTATTSMVLNLPVVPAQHERVVVSANGAAGAVYMEVDLKKNPSTP